MANLRKRAVVEMLGVFMLVYAGAGSILATGSIGSSSLLVVALAHGLALAIAVSIAMGISGGHINPAVTIGFLATKRIKPHEAAVYIVAQCIGASIAAAALLISFPAIGPAMHLGTPSLSSSVGVLQGIFIEAVLTFMLVLAVFGTAVDKRAPKIGGFGIGLMLAADIMFGGSLTGAAANPAVEIGPAIVSGFFQAWYVYWIGPIIGAVAAALIYEYLILKK